MITIEYNNEEYNIKNKLEEMSLSTFQKVTNVFQKKNKYFFQTWLDIIEALSDKSGVDKIISEEAFNEVIENVTFETEDLPIIGEIEINGVKYTSNITGDKINITAYQFSEIEKLIEKHKMNWVGQALAILFTTEDSDANKISEKVKTFNDNVTMNIALPYINKINGTFLKNFEKMNELK